MEEEAKELKRIDFVMTSALPAAAAVRVRRYAVVPHHWAGTLVSDHRPVVADLEFVV